MNILVTGAKGFVGKNLVETLRCIRDRKRRDLDIHIGDIYKYDIGSSLADLEHYAANCDFVFNLAGVNRPEYDSEFMYGNFGFTSDLLDVLKKYNNRCPVMFASSIQAALVGKYADSQYGRSKMAGEELIFLYAQTTGAEVYVYRLPNLFGKWCRPNYNSVIATFCNAFANDLPYTVNDSSVKLELLYIDDLVEELLSALTGNEHRCEYPEEGVKIDDVIYDGFTPMEKSDGRYCYVPVSYKVTLERVLDLLEEFHNQSSSLLFSSIPAGSFEKKLYSTYLSYLPMEKTLFDLDSSKDERGSFTEFFKNKDIGQFSINVSRPGRIKGQHWHHTKMEIFLVVKGYALIQERQIGTDPATGEPYPVREFEVSGDKLQCVYMLPGYTHNIINLSDKEDMVTVIWSNEIFDSDHPETYREEV